MLEILNKAPFRVKKHFINESFKKDEHILVQGDINEYLYFIQSGKVEVDTISKQGQKISITTFRAGESIGVLEIFNTLIHTQNVTVVEDCKIIKLHKNYVLEWMKEDFEFTLYVIKLLEECFYDTSLFARNILSMTIKERVITSLYKHYTHKTLSSLTKRELIQETGTQKRSLNRIIEQLTNQGMIQYENKKFTVLDLNSLTNEAKALM